MVSTRRRRFLFSSTSPSAKSSQESSPSMKSSPPKTNTYQRYVRSTATTRTTTTLVLWIFVVFLVMATLMFSFWSSRLSQPQYPPVISKKSTIGYLKGSGNDKDPIVTLQRPIVVKSNRTVVGMGGGYDLKTYRRFVGSLRSTGYDGHILLGVSSSVYHGSNRNHNKKGIQKGTMGDDGEDMNIRNYLIHNGVEMFEMLVTDCTYDFGVNDNMHEVENAKSNSGNTTTSDHLLLSSHRCLHPYTNLKIGWSSYPLARDWLAKCVRCTGPTLLTSISNVLFQRNPFPPTTQQQTQSHPTTNIEIEGLHLYEEHLSLTTENWRVAMPLRRCKNFVWDAPLLSSEIFLGDYLSIVEFIEVVVEEMESWMETPDCCSGGGDGMALVNYLFYDGRLGRRRRQQYVGGGVGGRGRSGGRDITIHRDRTSLVHSVVSRATDHSEAHHAKLSSTNDGNSWLSSSEYHQLIDREGHPLNLDGRRSTIVRRINLLGEPFLAWLDEKNFIRSTIPNMTGNDNHQIQHGLPSKGSVIRDGLSSSDHDLLPQSLLKHAVMEDFTDLDTKILQNWVIQHGADELETYYVAYYESEEEESEED